jgi:hypothetical protein
VAGHPSAKITSDKELVGDFGPFETSFPATGMIKGALNQNLGNNLTASLQHAEQPSVSISQSFSQDLAGTGGDSMTATIQVTLSPDNPYPGGAPLSVPSWARVPALGGALGWLGSKLFRGPVPAIP